MGLAYGARTDRFDSTIFPADQFELSQINAAGQSSSHKDAL
jgi:hypothetical protein